MTVLSLGWLGVRTAHFEEMSNFYRDVLELDVQRQGAADARFVLADQTEVHVYGSADEFHEFFGTAPVLGFVVDSFTRVRARMSDAGTEFLYPEPQRRGGRAWQHFRAPDGNVYELIGPDDLGDDQPD